MNLFYKKLRFWGHKLLPGRIRHVLYLLPYYIHIHKFMNDVNPDDVELFRYIEIETINRCNGECDFCPVNAKQVQRPFARMEEKLFKKIIDELSDIKFNGEIHLFSNNEPFLDDRIIEFAEYTRKMVPQAYVLIYTNGSLLSLDKVKSIIEYLDLLVIDNYQDSKNDSNIQLIQEWCMTGEKNAEKICIDKRDPKEILSSRGGNAPNKLKGSMVGVSRGCIYPFRQIVIRPDGKCSLCCNDALGTYTLGDINCNTLLEVWRGENYSRIRKTMKEHGRKKLKLCNNCDTHYFDGT